MNEPLSTWFSREILSHEDALLRYLRRVWPRRDEVPDLIQGIYVKCYEAAKSHRPALAKSFLFTVAHNHVVDCVRRKRIVFIDALSEPAAMDVLVDEMSPERHTNAHQELKALANAFRLLPARCREVVWLRKVDDIPQSEVARRLGISVRTVEVQVQRGVRILTRALSGETNLQASVQQNDVHGIESEN